MVIEFVYSIQEILVLIELGVLHATGMTGVWLLKSGNEVRAVVLNDHARART